MRPKTPAVLPREQSLDTCSLHIWAFFWEALYPQLAKQFRVLMVFCTHLSPVGLAVSKSCTYGSKSPSSNLKFLKTLAGISPNKVGKFLNPWGRTVQQYCWTTCVSGSAIQKKIAAVILPQIGTQGEKKPSFKSPNWVPAIFSQNNCEQSRCRVQLLNYFINSPQVWTKRYSAEFDFLTKRIGALYGDLQGFISSIFKNFLRIVWISFLSSCFRGYYFRYGVPPSLFNEIYAFLSPCLFNF